ncbi:MAG TPA: hypothetical protein VKB79_12065 [Bryobacteraceae bacterium]|nr:hypothetical protein [Bryobacteraceae bacterium]
MVNFKKVLGLAAPALVFAGMAFAQTPIACTVSATGAPYIRAEGTTEQLPTLDVVGTAPGTPCAVPAGPLTIQVFVTPVTNITSKVLTASTNTTEAVASIGGGAGVQGVVSGNQLTFSNVSGTGMITISNIRIDATKIPVATGIPNAVSVSVFITSGTAVVATTTAAPVAYVVNGLGTQKISGVNPIPVCVGGSASTAAFSVSLTEGFAGAFKTMAQENSAVQLGSPASNAANSGTRVKLVFANVPAGASLYVPTSVVAANGDTLTLTASETGALSPVSAATGSGVPANSGLVTIANGGGQAVYELTTTAATAAIDTYAIPVFVTGSANSITASSTAMTVAVSFAPIGSTNIPNFVVGSSTTVLTANTFTICQTNLLFSYVTNMAGYDTGLAIANTSTDPFGKGGAASQNGNCTLNFYGVGAPSAAVVTPMINGGQVLAQVLSSFAPGFQGYMIAQCNFQYGHGFAFITNGIGANGGLSQGYLANVIPSGSTRGTVGAESLGN